MRKKRVLLFALVLSLLLSLNLAVFAEEEIPSLWEAYSDYFLIGTAVNSRTLNTHRDLIVKHFNSITAENEMKFDALQPTEGIFNFYRADQMIEFAKENNIQVRGHVLVWHSQTPSWVFRFAGQPASKELLLERMRNHISTVVGRYKGQIYAWDVVNEAISDGPEIYRDSPWYNIIGKEFIAEAFRAAHEADPDAKLFYNDYNAVEPAKMQKIYNMLKELIEEGVPIHGVGIQGHWSIEHPDLLQIMRAIEKYASLGLEIHITELDLSVFAWDDHRKLAEPTPEMIEKQALRYKNLFNIFKRYSDHITSVTLWGVADDSTWKDNYPVQGRKDWPLLFDVNHQPKEAFWAVIEASK